MADFPLVSMGELLTTSPLRALEKTPATFPAASQALFQALLLLGYRANLPRTAVLHAKYGAAIKHLWRVHIWHVYTSIYSSFVFRQQLLHNVFGMINCGNVVHPSIA